MSQVKSMKIHIEKDCQNIVALKIDETPADLLPEDLVVGTRTKTGRKTAKNRRRALRSTKWYARGGPCEIGHLSLGIFRR